jgi:hypothetical protein
LYLLRFGARNRRRAEHSRDGAQPPEHPAFTPVVPWADDLDRRPRLGT